MGQVAFDPLAHQDTIQQAVAPFVKNPSGEAVAAIPQAALMLATAGAKGMPEESTQVPPDVPSPQSRIPNPVTAAKNLMAGPPEAQITKALQPNKNNVNWNADVKTALPQIKATEAQMGKPIEGFEGANAATTQTLKNIWSQVDTYLTRGGKIGATIDGNQIADAMVNSIDKRMATQNPAMAARVKELADTYRRPLSVNEAEDFIQSNNKELTGYYAKNKLSRQQAAADPEINAKIVEGDTLRDALYSKIDELSGPGVAQLKKAYGAVRNLQNNLTTQMQVYARKAPANLGEQLSYFQAAGKAITGHPIEALGDIAVRRFLSDLNDKNSMITRAFGQTQPAQPFPMPSAMPRIAGQLPAQTGGPFELPPANPMTGGERLAALMQMLRQRQQLSLPANVQPRQLPPSF
jgi:hypothetical protein